MRDIFRWFLLALRLSATKSEIKKNSDLVHWNVQTKPKSYVPKIIFQKKNSKSDLLTHIYFGPKFIFASLRGLL